MAAAQEITLIGLCDVAVEGNNASNYFTNKLGGRPELPLPRLWAHYPRCGLCRASLLHLLHIYCPLQGSKYHRTLHVFACSHPGCYGKHQSWRVLRCQWLDIKSSCKNNRVTSEAPMTANQWCRSADDWGFGDEEEQGETGNPAEDVVETEVTDRLDKVNLSDTVDGGSSGRGWSGAESVPMFKPYFISVFEERDLEELTDMEEAIRLLHEYERREGFSVGQMESNGRTEDCEKYEKTKAKHGDQVFSKFIKRISLCPKQILRYQWDGSPLVMTHLSPDGKQPIPACPYCGHSRIFEFQLMPAMINFLSDISSDVTVEFGTVLVYTCRNSCWSEGTDSPVEECVLVQSDPDSQLFL